MPNKKPKVFVGSSSEAIPIAREFCAALSEDATMIRWWRCGEFLPTQTTFDAILRVADVYDFGLFIMTPDDDIVSRDKKTKCARDNVILELGCFLGNIGPDRTFAVIQDAVEEKDKLKLISDLSGVHIPRFRIGDKDETTSSIENAVNRIREIIERLGRRQFGRDLRIQFSRRWEYDRSTKTFSMRLDPIKVDKHRDRIIDGYFLLVCRKRRTQALEHDGKIVIGKPRKIARTDTDILLIVQGGLVFSRLQAANIVDGALIFIEPAIKIAEVKRCKTIAEMEQLGCELVEAHGVGVGP